jgi:hypothetical protein
VSVLRIVAAICCLLLLSAPPLKAQGNTLRDPALPLSLPLPSGWRVADSPQSRFKIGIAASPVDGFLPNVNILKEESPLSLADYVSANLKGLKEESEKGEQFTDFRVVKQAVVKTKSGVTVTRVVCLVTVTAMGIRLRNQVYAVAGKGDVKYIITYSIPESVGSKFDSAVIASMTGFTLD